jgi:FAD/FMN-containing dehydrogenase
VTIPAGSCPTVGIAGLTLGGGVSYAGRKFGLTCDNVRGLSLVTAQGKLLECSASEHPDLFWACRGGGGGNFGIVTSFRFRTHPVSNVAYYQIVWPWANAADVVHAWQAFAPHAPDGLFSTIFMSTRTPKSTGTVPVISSGGQFFGTQSDLDALIAPLKSVGTPTRVVVGTLGYMDAVLRWAGCHPVSQCHTVHRLAFKGKSDFVNAPLSDQAIATLLAGLEANQRSAVLGHGELLFDAYGGAINRVPAAATAFVHRNALFSIQYFSSWATGAAANLHWIRSLHAAMRPHVSGFAYQNYIDPDLRTWKHAYYGSNLHRLVAVKRKYDPRSFFRFAQAIPPRL